MSEATATREIVSPEGVEERVVLEETFRITLTGGGKYRCYSSDGNGKVSSVGVKDTEEEARKHIGIGMGMIALLMADPQKGIEMMLNAIAKEPK